MLIGTFSCVAHLLFELLSSSSLFVVDWFAIFLLFALIIYSSSLESGMMNLSLETRLNGGSLVSPSRKHAYVILTPLNPILYS